MQSSPLPLMLGGMLVFLHHRLSKAPAYLLESGHLDIRFLESLTWMRMDIQVKLCSDLFTKSVRRETAA